MSTQPERTPAVAEAESSKKKKLLIDSKSKQEHHPGMISSQTRQPPQKVKLEDNATPKGLKIADRHQLDLSAKKSNLAEPKVKSEARPNTSSPSPLDRIPTEGPLGAETGNQNQTKTAITERGEEADTISTDADTGAKNSKKVVIN